jgi:hypothetical protein
MGRAENLGCLHSGLAAGSGSVLEDVERRAREMARLDGGERSRSRSNRAARHVDDEAPRGSAANTAAPRRPAVAAVSGSAQIRMAHPRKERRERAFAREGLRAVDGRVVRVHTATG